jgi:hypothetical protein
LTDRRIVSIEAGSKRFSVQHLVLLPVVDGAFELLRRRSLSVRILKAPGELRLELGSYPDIARISRGEPVCGKDQRAEHQKVHERLAEHPTEPAAPHMGSEIMRVH